MLSDKSALSDRKERRVQETKKLYVMDGASRIYQDRQESGSQLVNSQEIGPSA